MSSNSTRARKERNIQDRVSESLIEADKQFIAELKRFSDVSNSTAGEAGASVNNSPTSPAGNYLFRPGDAMLGPLALSPPLDFTIDIDEFNTINISPLNGNTQYSSNLQIEDVPTSSTLDIIAGATFDGQILILRTFAPTPITISQATLANGGNIQTPDDTDVIVGDLQMVILIFDEALKIEENTGGTWRLLNTFGTGGTTGDVSAAALAFVTPSTPTLGVAKFDNNVFFGSGISATNTSGVFKLSDGIFQLNSSMFIQGQNSELGSGWQSSSTETGSFTLIGIPGSSISLDNTTLTQFSESPVTSALVDARSFDVFVRLFTIGDNGPQIQSNVGTWGQIFSIGGGNGGGGDGYNLIQEEGAALTKRTTMNFLGDGVSIVDNPTEGTTDITIPGGEAIQNQNLGDLTGDPDPFVVDFNDFDSRQLFANLIGSATSTVTISFTNIPATLSANLKIYMTPQNDNSSLTLTSPTGISTLIFSGNTAGVNDPFEILPLITNDFLSIEFESTDQINIIVTSVKKNDEEEPAEVAPGIPGNIYAIGNTSTTAEVSWDQPEVGSLPILYTVVWSLDSLGNATTGPTNPVNQLTNIAENLVTAGLINALVPGTTYFFWVRGVNAVGSGDFAGGQQTNTEGTTNPGGVNFSVTNVLFNQATINWDQPGALLFTAFRTDSDGISNKVTFQTRKTTDPTIIDTENIQPLTEYKWTLETYNEFNVQLGTQTITDTTADIPIPVLTLSAVGRKLQFVIDFPAGINICRVQWDLVDTFDFRVASLQIVKTVPKGTAQQVTIQTQELSISTLFFVRAQFELNADDGVFNTTQSQITGTLSVPQKPEIDNITSGVGTNTWKLGVDFADSVSVGEAAVFTLRKTGSSGEYFSFPGNTWSRDDKPIDNIRAPGNEDEILVPRAGGGWGAIGTITVVAGAVTNIAISNGGNDYASGTKVRIYDDNDGGGGDGTFEGTAVVSGGQLTGVTIVNGGDNYDNNAIVFLPAESNDSNIQDLFDESALTGRVVAINAAGSSESDTETINPL